MFRYGPLCAALDAAKRRSSRAPGDEAQAFEWLGEHPALIEGSAANLKITSASDLALAEALLARGAAAHENRERIRRACLWRRRLRHARRCARRLTRTGSSRIPTAMSSCSAVRCAPGRRGPRRHRPKALLRMAPTRNGGARTARALCERVMRMLERERAACRRQRRCHGARRRSRSLRRIANAIRERQTALLSRSVPAGECESNHHRGSWAFSAAPKASPLRRRCCSRAARRLPLSATAARKARRCRRRWAAPKRMRPP